MYTGPTQPAYCAYRQYSNLQPDLISYGNVVSRIMAPSVSRWLGKVVPALSVTPDPPLCGDGRLPNVDPAGYHDLIANVALCASL